MTLKVVSVEDMRRLEREAEGMGLPGPALMENAGRAVSDAILRRYPPTVYPHVLVLAGPGNNGGDALVAARHLHDAGARVTVYRVNRPPVMDAKVALLEQRGIRLINQADDLGLVELGDAVDGSDLIVDGVLGTGRARPIAGALADLLDRVNARRSGAPVIAIDLPTGVDADTGAADPHALRADLTITLGHPKKGLLMGAAVDLTGELAVADIGIPLTLSDPLPTDYADATMIRPLLPARPRSAHKGTFGRVLIVAGSRLYTGAPVLAALGAEHVGAGLVTLACPASIRDALAVHTLETTFLPLPDDGGGVLAPSSLEPLDSVLDSYAAVLVGPGLGRAAPTEAFLQGLLARLRSRSMPVVIDADALTLLASWPRWWEQLPARAILTPHPGEMQRLTGAEVHPDRIEQARNSARAWKTVLVMKGAYTVIALPNGRAIVLPFANPALATAGTGDVLAGAILGLLGQGLETDAAALVGGFLHGAAGEMVRDALGPAGVLAAEVARNLPGALRRVSRGTLDNQTW